MFLHLENNINQDTEWISKMLTDSLNKQATKTKNKTNPGHIPLPLQHNYLA